MACVTGKTFTSLRIAEALAGKRGRVLYLVPSLALMSQTVREWAADATLPLRAYAVCSDAQVGRRRRRNDDRIDMDVLDLAYPATTDAVRLASETATYHSLPVIGQAQREHGLPHFDLAICDEAHRTAGARIEGEEDSAFVQIHDQKHVRVDRRLYMTATPKVYAESARNKAGQVNAALCSMENKTLYGPVLYEIGFRRAVEDGLLTDYKVNAVRQSLDKHELKLSDAGKLVGCWRALAKADTEEFPENDRQPMRRAIAYCRDIKSSKQVEKLFNEVTHEYRHSSVGKSDGWIPHHDVTAQHVDGTFNALRRAERLEWYHDIGDYLNREEKLDKVRNYRSLSGVDAWRLIIPDAHHDWLNQRDPGVVAFMAMGNKFGKSQENVAIFNNYTLGIVTSRDAWCYNYSERALRDHIQSIINFYNAERLRLQEHIARHPSITEITHLINNDDKKIKWSSRLKKDLRHNRDLHFDDGRLVLSHYRPFTRQYLYLSRRLNENVSQVPKLFPHAETTNRLICVTWKGETDDFSCLMVRDIPNLHLIASGQCFPRWLYAKPDTEKDRLSTYDGRTDAHGYVRQSAISDDALDVFRERLGTGLTADDLFHYIYGVLHVPAYRSRYAANFKKELPRIPVPVKREDFWALVEAGEQLGALHLNYDAAPLWPLTFERGGWEPGPGVSATDWFRTNKPMRHPGRGKAKDTTRIRYNDHITVSGIPKEAYSYRVNGKSAIAWVMVRQVFKKDTRSGLINDANRHARETMHDPSYPLKLLARVIYVSLETLRIVCQLPDPVWNTDAQSARTTS